LRFQQSVSSHRRDKVKKVVIPIVIVVAIVVVVGFVPLIEVPYPVTVQYQDTATYYVDEPYEETETYTEPVPLEYEVVESEGYSEGVTAVVSVVVRNEDSIAGTFNADLSVIWGCTFIKLGSIELTSLVTSDEVELYLEPNDAGTATYSADNPYPSNCGFDSWSYDVTPDTKEVEKERTVTKYRQVEKQRTVTKQRAETRYKKVTLLAYWLQ
jgi:hypothetical protein